jgi:hypothetical protein
MGPSGTSVQDAGRPEKRGGDQTSRAGDGDPKRDAVRHHVGSRRWLGVGRQAGVARCMRSVLPLDDRDSEASLQSGFREVRPEPVILVREDRGPGETLGKDVDVHIRSTEVLRTGNPESRPLAPVRQ